MKANGKSGFSLLEIMIVVTIIGFVAGLAIPGFMKARASSQKARCIDNLRQIQGAKESWAVENYANSGDPCDSTNVAPFFKRGFPSCPASGVYDVGLIGSDPTCTVSDHSI